MTKQEAKELAIKKWEWIIKNGGDFNSYDLEKAIPELKDILHYCAYCEIYMDKTNSTCNDCPLDYIKHNSKEEWCGCEQVDHPYNEWGWNHTVENAQKVLDLIKEK